MSTVLSSFKPALLSFLTSDYYIVSSVVVSAAATTVVLAFLNLLAYPVSFLAALTSLF